MLKIFLNDQLLRVPLALVATLYLGLSGAWITDVRRELP